MARVQVAVIGYGFAGRCFHSYLVGLVPELELRGICTANPERQERARQERGCRIYATFDEVLADREVELVILATPNASHCDLAVQALDAGKHVVADKVMCLNLAEYERMAAAAQRRGRLLTVFQNRRWDGDFLTLQQVMADGVLGEVRWLELAWQGFGAWGGWRGQKAAGGGKLYDLGAHLIDQVCLLFPEPTTSVYARLQHDLPETDTESHALVVVNFAGGRTAVVDTSSLAAFAKPRFYALGTKATFRKYGVDPQERKMIEGDIDAAVEAPENYARIHDGKTETVCPTLPGRWRNYYENIADVLRRGAKPLVTLESVRRQIAVLDAAFRSAAAGQAVSL